METIVLFLHKCFKGGGLMQVISSPPPNSASLWGQNVGLDMLFMLLPCIPSFLWLPWWAKCPANAIKQPTVEASEFSNQGRLYFYHCCYIVFAE